MNDTSRLLITGIGLILVGLAMLFTIGAAIIASKKQP